MELYELTAHEIRDMILNKKVTSQEITALMLERIKAVDEKVQAFITVCGEKAMEQAKKVDEKIKNGEPVGKLAGIPIGIKDNICTEGIYTTCGSKMLENFNPPYNATVVDRLLAEDAVILGKLNMDEFAMGSSTETSYFKKTRNPWDLERVPGGSSGGSAAAVAADEVYFALGSDTGGSIRQPASLCGVVGMKPTYGLVSRYGLVAFASSLDQIGPLTKDVEDCAMVLDIIAGYDKADSTSIDGKKQDFLSALSEDIKGMKVGIPKELFAEGVSEGVKERIYEAAKVFENMGAIVEETSLPYSGYALAVYYIIASAEASSNLARYDGIRYGYRADNYEDMIDLFMKTRSEGFGKEVKRRIMLGTYALSSGYYDAYYKRAQKVRTLIKRDFDRAFETYDILISPTSPVPAFKIGEKMNDPLQMYMSDICTVPINIAGIPAISVPAGFENGLPVGLQIIGKPFDEATILKAAYAYEKNSGIEKKKPALEVR
ncbi:aspartyl/glutamyl-tRNA(Asn/Gln) amidotransferase subunit A [Caldanaerobius fijiensis DSM 17918]|uniref:Glutamyl-tRNA(Gln) amidotransferase subunit A n=1 Tax=Caldanaerobius fijiensis DSM 17918 TaxID=1121256 RepID=A0A1M5CIP4_9THEO|nr:Asp-tRNA(Asn)/Glu-tRNA(Gln) amidotransferase subunit GatA [Caldanaerobius fijiensis]SHF54292.1 aspartyl/glutamyl-tRNA(Asn/Gln) amidotransferase subunit A [Caldanaerobius fijiensis DSM 17918]